MPDSFTSRLKHAWNVFMNRDPTESYFSEGSSYGTRPDRVRLRGGNERTIIGSIYNRIATDVAAISIQHVRLDGNGRYLETIDSGLNNCFTIEANVDQTAKAFVQDIVLSMFDEGCVAVVPVETIGNPLYSDTFKVEKLRTAKIVAWYPNSVRVEIYNDRTGQKEERILPKRMVAIIENPFYSVMNEPNSTLKRLTHKLALLDAVDDQASSGKLDMIIQLPYVIKTEARRAQAESRRKDIEEQLSSGKYGIAYTDGTEHITQLNRPVENNLMNQIEYLTTMLYSQLGLDKTVFDGTANDTVMNNYYNRTVEPILSAITDEIKRKFLTKTARSQKQSIMFFRDPFKLAPVSQIAEIADKFTRNEIMSSNEVRQILGMKPSSDPRADELHNSNMPDAKTGGPQPTNPVQQVPDTGPDLPATAGVVEESQNG